MDICSLITSCRGNCISYITYSSIVIPVVIIFEENKISLCSRLYNMEVTIPIACKTLKQLFLDTW